MLKLIIGIGLILSTAYFGLLFLEQLIKTFPPKKDDKDAND